MPKMLVGGFGILARGELWSFMDELSAGCGKILRDSEGGKADQLRE